MDNRPSTSRYILTALAVIIVFTAFVLVGLNALNLQNRIAPATSQSALDTTSDSYAAGYNAARQQFSKMCPMISQTANSFSGIIQSISSGSMVVRQDSLAVNARVDQVSDDRTVLVSAATVINRVIQKDPATLAKEQAAFQAQLRHVTSTPPNPPTAFNTQTLGISDLTVGQRVTVISADDVTLQSQIQAVQIQAL